MTKNLDKIKTKLIERISEMDSIDEINDLEKFFESMELLKAHTEVFRKTKESISIDELKAKQNYKGIDRSKLDKIVNELDIQESFEELLSMVD